MVIRPFQDGDADACVALNNANIPAVSEASREKFDRILGESLFALVAVDDPGAVIGFCNVMGPDSGYWSENFAWFKERYDDFVYLDRIEVDASTRSLGIGAALYAAVEERIAGTPWLTCEVNLRPLNEGSWRFHHRIGFTEVGRQETSYGILVGMLAKQLS